MNKHTLESIIQELRASLAHYTREMNVNQEKMLIIQANYIHYKEEARKIEQDIKANNKLLKKCKRKERKLLRQVNKK